MDSNKTIPYDKLHSTAISNEKSGYVPGKSETGDMISVSLLGVIIVFVLIFIFYKIINFIYIRKSIDELTKQKK